MNSWVKKSIELAHSHGYLDKLSKIYPINVSMARDISSEERERVKKALRERDLKQTVLELLKLEKFPIDDPYIGFLRKHKEAIGKNPKTVKRIGRKLLKMGFDDILLGASKEKSASRQFGQMFRKYLAKLNIPILDKNEFVDYKGTAILEGGDDALKSFAKEHLNYRGDKGLDLILKTKRHFVIGEAKFITTGGGTQDKSFREAISFVKRKSGNTIHIAILDGVLWVFNDSNKRKKKSLYSSVKKLRERQVVLSALLLKDFIKSLE